MNTNELMIGDWVFVHKPTCKGHRVDYINEMDEEIGADGEIYNVCDIEPIPLTPEILEKNGFKIDKNETYCKRYFFACNLGKVPQTVVEFFFFGEGVSADTLFKCWTKPESCDGENNIHICDLKSVHQLQHALRLCGIEKEIEL